MCLGMDDYIDEFLCLELSAAMCNEVRSLAEGPLFKDLPLMVVLFTPTSNSTRMRYVRYH